MLYLDVDDEGDILAYGTTPVNGSEIYVDVTDVMSVMNDIHLYKYIDGELVEKTEQVPIVNIPTSTERIEQLEDMVLQLLMMKGGDD